MDNSSLESWRRGSITDQSTRVCLPPPPDKRRVIQAQSARQTFYEVPDFLKDGSPSVEVHHQQVQSVVREILQELRQGHDTVRNRSLQIGPHNTTLIGDYVTSVYQGPDNKWLVQSLGNATWNTVIQGIMNGSIVVNFRYMFLMVGHNQVLSAKKSEIIQVIHDTVQKIRSINLEARIFVCSLLPRPIDNHDIKPHIVNFNRWIVMAVNRVSKAYFRVHHIPTQHSFIRAGKPKQELFNEDRITLNKAGALLLKEKMFEIAGFRKNVSM